MNETTTTAREGIEKLGELGDSDLVYVEDSDVCVGRVAPLPSQLIDLTTEDLEESLSDACEELPIAYLSAAMATRAVTGADSVRCDALTFCMDPSQARMRVCHVRGVCRGRATRSLAFASSGSAALPGCFAP